MEIALNETLAEAVRRRAREAGFDSPEAYVEGLVRADLERTGAGLDLSGLSPETRAAIREGLDSGPAVVADEAFWAERQRRLAESRGGG